MINLYVGKIIKFNIKKKQNIPKKNIDKYKKLVLD